MKKMRILTGLAAILFCLAAQAETAIQTVALFNDRAMLSINGSKAKIIKVGETYKGVKLISANTDHAKVEVEGRRETLTLDSAVVLSQSLGGAPPADKTSTQLWVDNLGFFRARGAINGSTIEFIVDTGANIVVLSSRHAERVGLEYKTGAMSLAATASGTSPMYQLDIDSLNFSGIELKNVRAGVIEGNFPVIPLLGMSYLDRLDMNRSGDMMTLQKR